MEITVVFDGAGVWRRPRAAPGGPGALQRPGVLADDVIRTLVGAEPQGRPVVVATSDKAVVAFVCAQGAHSVPSRVLLQQARAQLDGGSCRERAEIVGACL